MNKKNTKKTVGNLAVKEEPVIIENPKPDPAYVDALLANANEVNGIRHCVLPVNMLEVEDLYQRPIQKYVRFIAENWDPRKLGEPRVNVRDGRCYIVDGQNRVEAAKLKGIEQLMCTVTIGETREQEADEFSMQDEGKTKLSSYDLFHAQCAGENGELARQLKALMDEYHIVYANSCAGQKNEKGKIIPRSPAMGTPGRIGGISTIMKIGRACGLDMVETIFDMIQTLGWHTKKNAYSCTILSAMRNTFEGQEREKVQDKLYRALRFETPDSLIMKARSANDKEGPVAATTAYLNRIAE